MNTGFHSDDLFGDPPQKKLGIGYAGHPGMGPKGETCGSCTHSKQHGLRNRRYYKCHHELGYRSFSEASDIKLKTPACERWSSENAVLCERIFAGDPPREAYCTKPAGHEGPCGISSRREG